MEVNLPFLPWWDPEDTPASMLAAIQSASELLKPHTDVMKMFGKRSLLGFCLIANTMERTLPAGFDELATYQLMEAELDSTQDSTAEPGSPTTPTYHLWPAEGGGNNAETRQQLLQFVKAARFLCWPLKPLTVGNVRTAHKLMMWGAQESGALLQAGEFRTTPAHSGTGYVYPEPEQIPVRLPEIINNFNASLSSGAVPSYQLAADLLYQFVTLHPFQNGNGRMCRLLAAYAAQAAGVPFLLHLSNGHGKTRQHYQQVLRHADKHQGNTARLQSYILDCMHLQWQNALAYAGRLGAAKGTAAQ